MAVWFSSFYYSRVCKWFLFMLFYPQLWGKPHIFSSNAAYLTHGRVREAHLLGMPVLAWTVNDEKTMERLIDMGVDGIITDRPLLLKSVLDRRGIEY